MVDDATSPCEEVAEDASAIREEVDDTSSPGDSPQVTVSLRLENKGSSGLDHGDHDEVSTPEPNPPTRPPFLRAILS